MRRIYRKIINSFPSEYTTAAMRGVRSIITNSAKRNGADLRLCKVQDALLVREDPFVSVAEFTWAAFSRGGIFFDRDGYIVGFMIVDVASSALRNSSSARGLVWRQ